MYRLLRRCKNHTDIHFKSWAAQINAGRRCASTRAAAAEDKTSVDQLQQIFDDEKKRGGIVSVAYNENSFEFRLVLSSLIINILHLSGSCFQKCFVARQSNSH